MVTTTLCGTGWRVDRCICQAVLVRMVSVLDADGKEGGLDIVGQERHR